MCKGLPVTALGGHAEKQVRAASRARLGKLPAGIGLLVALRGKGKGARNAVRTGMAPVGGNRLHSVSSIFLCARFARADSILRNCLFDNQSRIQINL